MVRRERRIRSQAEPRAYSGPRPMQPPGPYVSVGKSRTNNVARPDRDGRRSPTLAHCGHFRIRLGLTHGSPSHAISDYVHTRDLANGRIRPEGIDLTVLNYPFEHVGLRFGANLEWEVSEFSLANYCALVAKSEPAPMVRAAGVPLRVFRQSAIFIRENSGIRGAADLAGRRVGIPQWSQTATVYVRGYLAHDVGIPLSSIEWIQAGVNQPGRKESAKYQLPADIKMVAMPDRTLSDMLVTGDVDAVITARPPDCFLERRPGIRRLFPNYREEEQQYFRRTGIFPIMHVVVVRRDAYERNRWIMQNLVEAFEAAKRATIPKLLDITTSFIPIAWCPASFEGVNGTMFPGDDPWPYGLAPNRITLDAFLAYCFEQEITARRLAPEELFPKELDFEIRI